MKAGDAQPPVALGGRLPVALVHDPVERRWRGVLAYAPDLDAIPAVRIVVSATVDATASAPVCFAIPKSTSFGPAGVSRMLSGFTSRWTMPRSCA